MKYFTLTLALLVMAFAVPAYANHPGGTARVGVNGLVCDFCARALEKVFGKEDAVESIKVDLGTKVVTIHFNEGKNLDDETITKFVTDSGYNVESISRDE